MTMGRPEGLGRREPHGLRQIQQPPNVRRPTGPLLPPLTCLRQFCGHGHCQWWKD